MVALRKIRHRQVGSKMSLLDNGRRLLEREDYHTNEGNCGQSLWGAKPTLRARA